MIEHIIVFASGCVIGMMMMIFFGKRLYSMGYKVGMKKSPSTWNNKTNHKEEIK